MFQRTADKPMTLKTWVYLSVSDLVGGGVEFVGEDTGLVSAGAPLRRLALTSAILQWNLVLSYFHLFPM